MINPYETRKDFPIFSRLINGKPLVYLDSAATTQKPSVVIDSQTHFYKYYNSNVHRGAYTLSEEATNAYENSRITVAKFLNVQPPSSIVFTRNATEAINLVAASWGKRFLKKDDEIVLSVMEHHSNLIPWQLIAQQTGAKLKFFQLNENFELDLTNVGSLITEKTKIVSLVHISNALGTINPIKEIGKIAHSVGAKMLVDASQSVQHISVDVQDLDCDFLVFSGHKALGPMGIGVLYGKSELLDEMPPYMGGGEMIKEVQLEWTSFREAPQKFEAGTPNVVGAIGLAEALKYIEKVGLDEIHLYEQELVKYAIHQLTEMEDTIIYGPKGERGGIVLFNIKGIHPHDVATILSEEGICLRAGHHCTQPLHRYLGLTATARASFYLYSTREEIDSLIKGLKKAMEVFKGAAV
jgi:cysteine desulfurase/selenocysteine lyase